MARRQVSRILLSFTLCGFLLILWETSRGLKSVDPRPQRHLLEERNLASPNSTQQDQMVKAFTQVRLEPQTIANIRNRIAKPLDPVSGVMSTGGQRSNNQRRVILMSYMRSGSTFTGDLFQSSPEVFYLYEPLLYTNDVDFLPRNMPIRGRLNPHFKRDVSNPPETEDYITSMLSCNFTSHNLFYLEGMKLSEATNSYLKCKAGHSSNFSDCMLELNNRCHKSQTVLAKVLRLRMWEIERLLSRDPILKVIHLVRDPRGMMASRIEAKYYYHYRDFCTRFKDDADTSATLRRTFPGRILTVRYEDLANRPIDITKSLYQFTGIEWTSKIKDLVLNRTHPKDKKFLEHRFGTMRKNSNLTAIQWRKKLDFATAQIIQNYCERPMSRYGYIPFASAADMLNDSLPAITQDYSDDYNKALADKRG